MKTQERMVSMLGELREKIAQDLMQSHEYKANDVISEQTHQYVNRLLRDYARHIDDILPHDFHYEG